jgi:peptidoglycan hydrolase-like amidase
MPNGIIEKEGERMIMNNILQTHANSADAIQSLRTTLVSNSKLADAKYITVYDEEEVNVYKGNTTMILPIKAAVLTGWRDKLSTGL